MQGKAVDVPPKVLTFMFASVTGWKIEYIESLPEKVIMEWAPMIQMKYRADCAGLM